MIENKTKLVKILSVVSAAVMALAILAFFCCVILQKPLVRLYLNNVNVDEIDLFLFPFDAFCALFLGLVLSVALIFVSGSKKIGVWADVLIAAFSVIIKPVTVYFIGLWQNLLVTRVVLSMGSELAAYNSAFNSVVSVVTSFSSLGVALLYVVCGMSVILKLFAKQK